MEQAAPADLIGRRPCRESKNRNGDSSRRARPSAGHRAGERSGCSVGGGLATGSPRSRAARGANQSIPARLGPKWKACRVFVADSSRTRRPARSRPVGPCCPPANPAGPRETLRLKSVRDAAGLDVGIARGPNVHAAVAHHHGALACRAALFKQCLDADRIRLLLLEAVSSVDLKEMPSQAPALPPCERLNRTGLLVNTAILTSASQQPIQRLLHARIRDAYCRACARDNTPENIRALAPRRLSLAEGPRARRISTGAPLPT